VTVTVHPSDEQLARFVAAALPPDAVLEVDDHLAICPDCRARARALRPTDGALAALEDTVATVPADTHLRDDEVQAYVDGTLDEAARADADDHLERCEVCARQIEDLRGWAAPPARRGWPAYAWVASILLAILGPIGYWQWQASRPPDVAGIAALPADLEARVREAVTAGRANVPPWMAALAGQPEVTMGPPAPAAAFRVVSPLATAVATDRPTFHWEPLAGATEYTVTIADVRGRAVASSSAGTGTTFTPAVPLPATGIYTWQVTARVGTRTVLAPAPPAPAAHFVVLDASTRDLLARLEREQPDAHVLLGILYAQAGVIAEARRHLAAVPATDPHAALARRTLQSLGVAGRS
jgi:hypothetical protein